MSTPDPPMLTVEEWLARSPSHAQSLRDEVGPFRRMTPAERLQWFVRLQKSMDAFVRLHPPSRDPADGDFWRHGCDPSHGRPR